MTRRINFFISAFLVFILFIPFLNAETVQDNEYEYSLDIPEGFKISGTSGDGMALSFQHEKFPVEFILKIITDRPETDTEEILTENLDKLNAFGTPYQYKWHDRNCSISTVDFSLDQDYQGWSICTSLNERNCYIVLIAYSPIDQAEAFNFFQLSILNSLCVNKLTYNFPGPVLTFVFPSEGQKPLELDIEGIKVNTFIDNSDEEAAEFLINMEYSVLLNYTNDPKWQEAWQRYYRMIYRDSFGRIVQAGCDIYNTLSKKLKNKDMTQKNADLTYAQTLLSWVQKFDYKRASSSTQSDFTSLPAVLCGAGNDCDSRSLLVATLLQIVEIDSFILISREYSHAVVVTKIDAPGQKYNIPGTDLEYLIGETTANVTWGMIAQEQADRSKWIPVYLP